MKHWQKITVELIAALLIFLFVYTALSKLMDFAVFKAVLISSPLIGKWGQELSLLIPSSELIISFLILLPARRRMGFITALVLLTLFTIYIALMIALSLQQSCTCGGVLRQLSWKQHLLFNSFFILITAMGLKLIHPPVFKAPTG